MGICRTSNDLHSKSKSAFGHPDVLEAGVVNLFGLIDANGFATPINNSILITVAQSTSEINLQLSELLPSD